MRIWINLDKKEEAIIREAVLMIAKWEFPQRWENLTPVLMSFLDPNQIASLTNFRAFKLLSKLIHRYEYSTRSDDLYREIILVADTTADYLLTFAQVYII